MDSNPCYQGAILGHCVANQSVFIVMSECGCIQSACRCAPSGAPSTGTRSANVDHVWGGRGCQTTQKLTTTSNTFQNYKDNVAVFNLVGPGE